MCKKGNFIFALFPLSSYINIASVIEKLKTEITNTFPLMEKDISFMVFDVLEDADKTIKHLLEFINQNEPQQDNIYFTHT